MHVESGIDVSLYAAIRVALAGRPRWRIASVASVRIVRIVGLALTCRYRPTNPSSGLEAIITFPLQNRAVLPSYPSRPSKSLEKGKYHTLPTSGSIHLTLEIHHAILAHARHTRRMRLFRIPNQLRWRRRLWRYRQRLPRRLFHFGLVFIVQQRRVDSGIGVYSSIVILQEIGGGGSRFEREGACYI